MAGRDHALQTANGESVLLTSEWKLQLTADRQTKLFRKPADRFDVNDLAGRNREELESMTNQHAALTGDERPKP